MVFAVRAVLLAAIVAGAASAQEEAPEADPPIMTNVPGSGHTLESRGSILRRTGVPVIEPTTTISIQKDGTPGDHTNGYRDVNEGRWVGTYGFDSCVGMVVMWDENGKKRAMVSHFNVEDDPEASIKRFETANKMAIPAGAYAYIGGGDDSSASNYALKGMIAALQDRGVKIRSYIPFSSLWVNGGGRIAYSADRTGVYAKGFASQAAQDAMTKRSMDAQRAAFNRIRGMMAQTPGD